MPALPAPRAAQNTIPDAGSKRLALMVSDSTEKQLAWLKGAQERNGMNPLMSDIAHYWDINLIAERIVVTLKKRFADAVLVEDMNTFIARKLDYAAVVDIGSNFIIHGQGDTEGRYDLGTTFLDPQARVIGETKGAGASRLKWFELCGMFPGFECVRRYSLVQLKTSLDGAFQTWEADLGKIVR